MTVAFLNLIQRREITILPRYSRGLLLVAEIKVRYFIKTICLLLGSHSRHHIGPNRPDIIETAHFFFITTEGLIVDRKTPLA